MVAALLFMCWSLGPAEETEFFGYLGQPAYCVDYLIRCPVQPYLPQPGDIVLTGDRSPFWTIGFALAGSGQPHHSAIVIALPDGQLAMAESGPHDEICFGISELMSNLCQYEQEGRVWIRRRCVPLTPDQSNRLTAFALAQGGKRFALIRMGAQLTPFRSRGLFRTCFIGRPHGERRSYFCSEFVLEACVYAGLLDSATTRPAATYPRDIFFDRSANPYLNRHLDLSPGWYPPARWIDE
jgi:hypothetical protein